MYTSTNGVSNYAVTEITANSWLYDVTVPSGILAFNEDSEGMSNFYDSSDTLNWYLQTGPVAN